MFIRINQLVYLAPLLMSLFLTSIATKAFSYQVVVSLNSDLHSDDLHSDDLHSADLHNNRMGSDLICPDQSCSRETDVFVLAGDIDNGLASIEYAKRVAEKYNKPVILVAGNHEYLGHDYEKMQKQFRQEADKTDNVYFLEKDAIVLENVRYLGCTLWSDFKLYGKDPDSSLYFMDKAEQRVKDFKFIFVGEKKMSAEYMAKESSACTQWLNEQLAIKHTGPTVVITHFAPVPGCVAEKWRKKPPEINMLSPYFVNDLTDLIESRKPDFWLYGHTHSNINLQIGKTKIISNQKGHKKRVAVEGYQANFRINIDVEE